jgi:hypothetical protein
MRPAAPERPIEFRTTTRTSSVGRTGTVVDVEGLDVVVVTVVVVMLDVGVLEDPVLVGVVDDVDDALASGSGFPAKR